MQHPHHLHALTTAWALSTARAALAELRLRRLPVDDTRDGLRSTAWGSRGSGGFGDPVGRAALTATDHRDHLGDIARSVAETLTWLARSLAIPYAGPDPLPALIAAIPSRNPAVAGNLTQWLREAAERIRAAIGAPERLTAWPGDCPACGQRLLQLHDAAPRPDWTVTCSTDDCLCAGDGCPCRMPVRQAGVTHIWLRSTLVAPVAVPSAA